MSEQSGQIKKDLLSFVTFLLSRTQNKLNAQASHVLKRHSDLSLVEWRVIRLLWAMEETTLSELAAEIQMDKGQLSRNVTAMINKDLIRSKPDPKDQRRQLLSLTNLGVKMNDQLIPIMQKRQDLLTSGISAKDMKVFQDVLSQIDKSAEIRDIT